mgnify:CR=1 FL=1
MEIIGQKRNGYSECLYLVILIMRDIFTSPWHKLFTVLQIERTLQTKQTFSGFMDTANAYNTLPQAINKNVKNFFS